MITTDNLRNNIIDKLLTISNKDYLATLYQLIDKSSVEGNIVNLTDEQILMLQLSNDDIKSGRLVNHEDQDNNDIQWLKDL